MLSHGSSISRGVAILIKKKGVDCIIHSKTIDPLRRFILLRAEIANEKYTLINIYAPNKDNDLINFFENLRKILQEENLEADEKSLSEVISTVLSTHC